MLNDIQYAEYATDPIAVSDTWFVLAQLIQRPNDPIRHPSFSLTPSNERTFEAAIITHTNTHIAKSTSGSGCIKYNLTRLTFRFGSCHITRTKSNKGCASPLSMAQTNNIIVTHSGGIHNTDLFRAASTLFSFRFFLFYCSGFIFLYLFGLKWIRRVLFRCGSECCGPCLLSHRW